MDFIANHTPIFYFIQPLWRDEAFSVLLSQHSLIDIVRLTVGDFNPPLYYFLLHVWMQLFGNSEMSVRSLSLVFHVMLVYVVYCFIRKIFPATRRLPYYGAFLAGLNPMLLYFAFEARMYSLLVLFATLSMYCFATNNWVWYVIFSLAGLYTQPFMVLVIIAQVAYTAVCRRRWLIAFIKRLTIIGVGYAPWIVVLASQLKQSGPMWISKMDLNLATSALGNLYLGFEGTPFYLWMFTKILSLLLLGAAGAVWMSNKRSSKTKLIIWWMVLPTVLATIVSFIKPIFVNRYLIAVSVAQVMVIIVYLSMLGKHLQRIIALLIIGGTLLFNLWYVPFHAKVDFRTTVAEIQSSNRSDGFMVAKTPLSFFEVMYYAKDKSRVFLYNPNNIPVLPYLGSVLIPDSLWIRSFPSDTWVYLIEDNGTYTTIQS